LSKSVFKTEFWLPVPLSAAKEFFSDPNNLVKISPTYLNMKLSGDVVTEEGKEFDISMHPFGLPIALKWTSRIADVIETEDIFEFKDIQVKGPFKSWTHSHRFVAGTKKIGDASMAEAGTWFYDLVEYEFSVDLAGVLDALVLKRILSQMFSHRKKALREHFAL